MRSTLGHNSAAALALPVKREADGHPRRADSSARSPVLTTPLCNELAVGVQHNCSYMLASCCALIAADSTAAAAAGRAGRVESLDAIDADPAAAANAAALDAAHGRHSPHDGAVPSAAALRRLARARTARPLVSHRWSPVPLLARPAGGVDDGWTALARRPSPPATAIAPATLSSTTLSASAIASTAVASAAVAYVACDVRRPTRTTRCRSSSTSAMQGARAFPTSCGFPVDS